MKHTRKARRTTKSITANEKRVTARRKAGYVTTGLSKAAKAKGAKAITAELNKPYKDPRRKVKK